MLVITIFELKGKRASRGEFPAEMDSAVHIRTGSIDHPALTNLALPEVGLRLFMLRNHYLQQCFKSLDVAMNETLYGTPLCEFCSSLRGS